MPVLSSSASSILRSALTAALLLVSGSAAADAQGRIIPRPCPPLPCPRDGRCAPTTTLPCGDRGTPRVEHVNTRVRVALADRVLRYEVTETFQNRGGNLGEADYMFPLPSGAAFEDVRLEINGEMVAGETMDAGRARSEYERIVREQRDPALVEWMGAGLLRARIFPFNAGEQRRIAVRYQQVAPREGDALRVEFRRPDATDASRSSLQIELPANGYGEPYSPTHDLTVSREGNRRIAELRGNARDVVVLIPVPKTSSASIGVLTHAAGTREKFALITVAPPQVTGARSPRDITFVVDVSGSMSGGKLAQAKAAGRQLLNSLDEGDRFRIVDFATDVHSFRDNFVAATPANIRAAQNYLDDLRAEGSTNISGALQEALDVSRNQSSERLSLMLFLTDGEPTVGIRNGTIIADSVRSWRGRTRLFTFGLGADVNASLVEQLALDGRGLAHFVRPDESVERMVGLVASRLQRPLLTDVRVEGVGVRLVHQYPSASTDLYAGQELVVLARYEGDGPGAVRVTGQGANGRVDWRTNVSFPDRSNANAFVPRLWATQRIGWLSAERRRDGGSPELDDELRTLGMRYGIPTELTSYMVQEPRRTAAMNMAPGAGLVGRVAGMSRASGAVTTAPVAQSARSADSSIPAAAPALRQESFEQAKAASAQRMAKSVATIDSLNDAAMGADADKSGKVRSASNRRFELQNGVWVETRLVRGDTPPAWTLRVQAYSPAWFALVNGTPALKEAFALGDRVRLAGRAVLLEVAPDGVTTIDSTMLTRFTTAW